MEEDWVMVFEKSSDNLFIYEDTPQLKNNHLRSCDVSYWPFD